MLLRFQLKQHILRKFKVIYEGVPRPGKQQLLDTIYVQPQISRRLGNGIDPAPGNGGSFVDVKDLLQLRKASGEPVRTLVTTGTPGIGMSVIAARFSMDWAEDSANKVCYMQALGTPECTTLFLSFTFYWGEGEGEVLMMLLTCF